MKRFGYLFTSHIATVVLLVLILGGELGSGLLFGWAKEWADWVRLINSVISVTFLILLHNRDYRGAQHEVEEESDERS